MDNIADDAPPRKKLKQEHFNNMEDQVGQVDKNIDATKEGFSASNDVEIIVNPGMYTSQDVKGNREADVGILAYVSPDSLGFNGIFKKRYSDFIVNEILPSGDVVRLKTLEAPKAKVSQLKEPESGPPEAEDSAVNDDELKPNPGNKDTTENDEGLPPTDDKGAGTGAQSDLEGDRKGIENDSTPHAAALAKWEESRDRGEIQVSPADHACLLRFFNRETVDEVVHLFNRVINSPHRSRSQYGIVHSKPITDRELRKEAHEAIKRVFRHRLDSSTDSKGVITIGAAQTTGENTDQRHATSHQSQRGGAADWKDARKGGRGRGREGAKDPSDFKAKKSQKQMFHELGGDYLHFTLYKENKDTLEVISYVAKQLHVRPNAFQFAGNKDRRAVTAQKASVYRIFPDRLSRLSKNMRSAKLGDFEFRRHQLVLGELQGNAFCITLRDCKIEDVQTLDEDACLKEISERVCLSLQNLSEKGFLNYFGLQRFGSFATRTDEVGMKLLQGDLKGAVDSILLFSAAALAAATYPNSTDTVSRDDKARAVALNQFKETGKSRPALDNLPRKFSAESNLIRWLGEEGRSRDYKNALASMPRNLRMMYVHAYQSLIWNLAASYRWKTWGTQVLEGDLVLVREHEIETQNRGSKTELDTAGEVVVRPGENDRAITDDERFERARALSAEEAVSGQYTIYDVVLPLPGFDIVYPEYMVSFYKETMGSDKYGNLDPFDMTRSWKDLSLSGTYRKILAKPLPGHSWRAFTYEHEDQTLVSTDLDILFAEKAAARGMKDRTPELKHAQGSTPQATSGDPQNSKVNTDEVAPTDPKPVYKPIPPATPGDLQEPNATPMAAIPAEAQPAAAEAASSAESSKDVAQQPPEPETKPRKRIGVTLEFKLGTAQYATMALRELMKQGGAREHKPDFSGGRTMD